jgi:hypothetical protein
VPIMLNHVHRFMLNADAGLAFMPALDTITSTGTAIGAALAATTIAAGDSFQVKNAAPSADVLLLNFWADVQVAGMARIRTPKGHDNVDMIRTRTAIGIVKPLMPLGAPQRLYPQDVEIVELAGSAVAGDVESVVQQVWYSDLPGQNARLFTWDEIKAKIRNMLTVRLAITQGTTAGYNGARAINADVDLLKANQDYAVLGMTTDVECAALCLRGPDTANLRVSVPGEPDLWEDTAWWFRMLSMHYGLKTIPVINSANKGGTLIDAVNDENGGTSNVTIYLAELNQ